MLSQEDYSYYLNTLKDQLIPATGCTEPIALAYAAALARKTLGCEPNAITVAASGSIIKNVKSVVVPMTDGMKGIASAVAAGIVAGDPNRELQVLADAPENTHELITAFLQRCPVDISLADTNRLFDIQITAKTDEHTAFIRIADKHTYVACIRLDDQILESRELQPVEESHEEKLKISKIVDFANTCRLEDISATVQKQISCNSELSEEGLHGHWGAEIGRIILAREPNPSVRTRAMAAAAAGSDARMSGCELPAVINSGSGNQGLTITMPILEYAREWQVSQERLLRSLVLANLIAVRIKQSIGYLSAYCGAICAGCSAAAGIAYLDGADESLINHTVVNGLAILSGTICDGAKPSCAGKIAMAVDAGLLGYDMAKNGKEFKHGEGIIKKGIENTIEEVGILGRDGMDMTNQVILDIMINH